MTRKIAAAGIVAASLVASFGAHSRAQQVSGNAAADGDATFAWNRSDRYAPPDFEAYFPANDAAAARRLDDFLSSQRLREESPAEFLETVRRGLRSTRQYKSRVLTLVGNTFIWNVTPQNPAAIELMYHACASPDHEVRHFAMYQGITVVADRSPNLLRMIMEQYAELGELQDRVHWGFKTYGDQQKTAQQLVSLLDESDQLGEAATLAAVESYRRLTGKEPPRAERFANLGRWVVAFHHRDVPARASNGPAELRRLLREELQLTDEEVVDFAARIDDQFHVGVVLVNGLARKDRLVERIKSRPALSLDFVEPLDAQIFLTRRLREFARHLPAELPPHATPAYTARPVDETYAWNRDDRYEPPNFAVFFPDDPAAGRRLDALYETRDRLTITDRELLEAFRQGLRHSSLRSNVLFSWLASALGWPADPYQTEIMYQAADPAAPQRIRHDAVYFGLSGWWKKSDNVLRLFHQILVAEPYDRSYGSDTRGRILWSMRGEHEKEFLAELIAETLAGHRELNFLTLVTLDDDYRGLTGQSPEVRTEYEGVGLFLVGFRLNAANDVEDLAALVESKLSSSKHWVAFTAKANDQEPIGYALVRGLAGRDWLIEQLKDDNSVDFVSPFAAEVFVEPDAAEFLDQVSVFKQYLQDDGNQAGLDPQRRN